MQKIVTAIVLLLLWAPAQSRSPDMLGQLMDRAAIHEVMKKYIWSVDALDADGYVSVFTEDAEVDSNGVIHEGRAEIRKVVTDLQARQSAGNNRCAATISNSSRPAGVLQYRKPSLR